MKSCNKCLKEKPLSEFSKNKTRKDWHSNWCKECKRDYTRSHYLKNKDSYIKSKKQMKKCARKFMFDYLSKSSCKICWHSNPISLEFHHIDPSNKKYTVSCMQTNSVETIASEIDKCVVLCSNCHACVTAKENNWYKDIEWIEEFYL